MIRCIAPNNINVRELSDKFNIIIKEYFSDINVILESNTSYWKEPNYNSIIYSILNNNHIKISNLITIFPLSWNYSKGHAYKLDIQQKVESEDAIWSKLCHPEEVFMNPIIDWVHIYTSELPEEPIIG